MEKYAILILIMIVIGLQFTILNLNSSDSIKDIRVDLSKFEKASKIDESKRVKEYKLSNFDPNTVGISKLQSFGLTDKFILEFLKYRGKIKRFNNIDDLKKLYCINEYPDFALFAKIKKPLERRNYTINKSATNKRRNKLLSAGKLNPNKLKISDWNALGFRLVVAKRIHKYLNTGAKFYSKNDLLRIYGIDTALIYSLESKLQFENKKSEIIEKIDLNKCSKSELISIKGIGSVFSERIYNYISELGGLYSIFQLKEVYGIDDELINIIKDHISISKRNIKKMNINRLGVEELMKHPYVSRRTAIIIINRRDDYGHITDLEQIAEVLPEELYKKISPYIALE
jgi:DNA uptake protein ComE-like DNA-binding protein